MAVRITGSRGGGKSSSGTFEVKFPEIGLFVAPEKLRAVLRSIEADHVDLAMQAVRGHVAERTPIDQGTAARGWQTERLGAVSGDIVGGRVINTIPHAIVLDQGRRPGFGVSLAGQVAIGRWVNRVLGLSGRDAERATMAIVYKIRKRGMPARRFVASGLEASRGELSAIEAALARVYADAVGKPGGAGA